MVLFKRYIMVDILLTANTLDWAYLFCCVVEEICNQVNMSCCHFSRTIFYLFLDSIFKPTKRSI